VTLADSPISEEGGRKPNVLNRIDKISYGHLYLKKEDENQMSSTG
jgi:hypothetical protein